MPNSNRRRNRARSRSGSRSPPPQGNRHSVNRRRSSTPHRSRSPRRPTPRRSPPPRQPTPRRSSTPRRSTTPRRVVSPRRLSPANRPNDRNSRPRDRGPRLPPSDVGRQVPAPEDFQSRLLQSVETVVASVLQSRSVWVMSFCCILI